MNLNPWISFPPAVDFYLINDLIRETCRVAFTMQTLDPPLDLAFARDGEVYNNSKYGFKIVVLPQEFGFEESIGLFGQILILLSLVCSNLK